MKVPHSLISLSLALVFGAGLSVLPGEAKQKDWWAIGKAKNNSGDYQGALRAYNEALKLHPHQSKSLRGRAASLTNLGIHDRALKDIDQAIDIEPAESCNYSVKGHILENLSRYDEAISHYRKAIAMSGSGWSDYSDLVRALMYCERYNDAKLFIERAIRKWPNVAVLYENRAQVLLCLNKNDLAWQANEHASNIGSSSKNYYDLRSRVLYAKGDLPGAIACLRAGIAMHPNDAWLHSQMSRLLLFSGDHDSAIRAANTAIRIYPASGYASACWLFMFSDKEMTRKCIEPAIKLNPWNGSLYQCRASLRVGNDDFSGALKDYEMAIKLEPWNYQPHQGKGRVLDETRRYDEAILEYKKAEELGGSLSYISGSIAYILMLQKKWDKAEAYFDTAIEFSNDNRYDTLPMLYSSRASCRYTQGKFDSAVKDYAISYNLERSSFTMECWRRLLWEHRDYCAYLNTFVTEYFRRA